MKPITDRNEWSKIFGATLSNILGFEVHAFLCFGKGDEKFVSIYCEGDRCEEINNCKKFNFEMVEFDKELEETWFTLELN